MTSSKGLTVSYFMQNFESETNQALNASFSYMARTNVKLVNKVSKSGVNTGKILLGIRHRTSELSLN